MKVVDVKFERWPDIEALYNVRRTVTKYSVIVSLDDGATFTKVTYRPKIKLHGSNLAIHICEDGIVCQSRNNIITPEDDNAGSAAWAHSKADLFATIRNASAKDCTLFGEWCGKGIQNAVSISKIDKKIFAVFSVKVGEQYIIEPTEIEKFLSGNSLLPSLAALAMRDNNIYILPWYSEETYTVSLLGLDEEFADVVAKTNSEILKIEEKDPWVSETFGIDGPGEGLVFYPISHMNRFSDLVWKAKGEKHRVKATKEAVQIVPEKIEEARKFAEIFTTEARLVQGATAISSTGQPTFDPKLTGQFIGWVTKDVNKECQTELEESGLDWKEVSKQVTDIARRWFMGKVTKGN